jgi:hypothetical protein
MFHSSLGSFRDSIVSNWYSRLRVAVISARVAPRQGRRATQPLRHRPHGVWHVRFAPIADVQICAFKLAIGQKPTNTSLIAARNP